VGVAHLRALDCVTLLSSPAKCSTYKLTKANISVQSSVTTAAEGEKQTIVEKSLVSDSNIEIQIEA